MSLTLVKYGTCKQNTSKIRKCEPNIDEYTENMSHAFKVKYGIRDQNIDKIDCF